MMLNAKGKGNKKGKDYKTTTERTTPEETQELTPVDLGKDFVASGETARGTKGSDGP